MEFVQILKDSSYQIKFGPICCSFYILLTYTVCLELIQRHQCFYLFHTMFFLSKLGTYITHNATWLLSGQSKFVLCKQGLFACFSTNATLFTFSDNWHQLEGLLLRNRAQLFTAAFLIYAVEELSPCALSKEDRKAGNTQECTVLCRSPKLPLIPEFAPMKLHFLVIF